jgi:hypothetical protein
MEYKYDAENHVVAAGINFVTPTSQYVYNANGIGTNSGDEWAGSASILLAVCQRSEANDRGGKLS